MAAPWMIRALVVLVVMSALAVSYSVHQARRFPMRVNGCSSVRRHGKGRV